MKENTDKNYFAIITEEDTEADRELDYYANNPWHGLFVTVVYGDNAEELLTQYDCEGLFYQLYVKETGRRIGYGIVSLDVLNNDIASYEDNFDYIICLDDLFWHFETVNGRRNMEQEILSLRESKKINIAYCFSVQDKIVPAGIPNDSTPYIICGEGYQDRYLDKGYWNIVDGHKINMLLQDHQAQNVLIFPLEVSEP